LRESQSESQSWHEKATGLFTQWQQQLTSRWSWLARYEYEHSQRSALQTGTPLQETERTNFRLRQSWSFTDDLQANFELSHSQENEKVKSQRQDEQRIGVSIRSVF
jgi:outer membrane receptor for ferrienterochelin and colicin